MMKKAVKNIIVRVIKSRMAAGEKFGDIIKSYPKLSAGEIKEIKDIFKDICTEETENGE